MEAVEHTGYIESIQGNAMRVRIVQSSACSGCHASQICSSADKQEKLIDIPFFTGKYTVGQKVTLTGQASLGLKAVALAYVFPLLLMLTGLAASYLWIFPSSDGIAALIAIGITILYYISLYPFRNKLQSRFIFSVKPFEEEPATENEEDKNNSL
jgi:Positive regulator of sigma E activity